MNITARELIRIDENVWEILKTGKMLILGRIFASEELLAPIRKSNDQSLEQIAKVAHLPWIHK